MSVEWGPRGYPGSQGLTGATGQKGDKGDAGQGVTIIENGNGTYTVVASNGAAVIRDGHTPVAGVDYFVGQPEHITYVFAKVLASDPPPTITDGSGFYDGVNETPPLGSANWGLVPISQIGYTTYVSVNRYIYNSNTDSWELLNAVWPTPAVYSTHAELSNSLTSYIFTRAVTQPNEIPKGGTYLNPMPLTPVGVWSDGIPSGTEPVWMSKKVFSENGQYPQDDQGQPSNLAPWSTPVLLGTAGEGIKLRFSTTHSLNENDWHDAPTELDEWMATCTGQPGAWVCDYVNAVKIKGESGADGNSVYLAAAFKRSTEDLTIINAGQPEIPQGGSFANPVPNPTDPSGWTDYVPEGTADLYISNRKFTVDGQGQDEFWTGAKKFSGSNASNFVLSSDAQVFAYDDEDPPNITPSSINFTVVRQHVDVLPSWTFDPPITIAENTGNPQQDTMIVTAAEFDAADIPSLKVTAISVVGAVTYSDTITIVKVANGYTPIPGIDYNDGVSIFQSSVYKAANTQPAAPIGGSYDGTTEVVPPGWSDDPVAPGEFSTVWVSKFTYRISETVEGFVWDDASQPTGGGPTNTGTGGTWSTPVQYVYIPQEGVDFFNGTTFLSYVFKNVAIGSTPSTPTGGSYVTPGGDFTNGTETPPTGWTDDPVTPAEDEITWVSTTTYSFSPEPAPDGTWTNSGWSTPSKFSGTAGITGLLTNEAEVINCDENGIPTNINWLVSGKFKVYAGTTEVTTDVNSFSVYSNTPANQVSAAIDSAGNYTVSKYINVNNWINDTATITFRANYKGYIIDKTLSLSKANNGADGEDGGDGTGGITVLLSNGAHVIPTNADGTVITGGYVGSGTTIKVYEGGQILNCVSASVVNPTQPGTWALQATPVATNITAGARTLSGTSPNKYITSGEVSNMNADTGSIVYTVKGITTNNVSFSGLDVQQSFAKARSGAGAGIYSGIAVGNAAYNYVTLAYVANGEGDIHVNIYGAVKTHPYSTNPGAIFPTSNITTSHVEAYWFTNSSGNTTIPTITVNYSKNTGPDTWEWSVNFSKTGFTISSPSDGTIYYVKVYLDANGGSAGAQAYIKNFTQISINQDVT